MTLAQYLPVFVFIIIALALGIVMLGAGSLLSTHKPDKEKMLLMNAVLIPLRAPVFHLILGFI